MTTDRGTFPETPLQKMPQMFRKLKRRRAKNKVARQSRKKNRLR